VDEQGNILNTSVSRSVCPELDAEALRVVEMMPKWKPGKPENVTMTLPICFKLAVFNLWPYQLLA
jgi:hypothetical protein